MKLGERAFQNAIVNTVTSFVPLALNLVLWPYIVATLGESSYGILALVTSVVGYFALLDLGLGDAVIKYMAEHLGAGDLRGANTLLGVAAVIFLVVAALGAALVAALAGVLAGTVLKIPPDMIHVTRISLVVAAAGFFFTMLLTLSTAVLNGMNRYDVSSLINAAMGVTTSIGTAILLFLGRGLLPIVVLNCVVPFVVLIIHVAVIRRLQPGLRVAFSLDRPMMKRVFGFGMFSLMGRVTDIVNRQLDLLIIGAMLTVSAVTYFVIPFTVLNRITGLIGRAGVVVFPAVSELHGQQRATTIQELYITASRLILTGATALLLPVLVLGPRFLHLWMSPGFAREGGLCMVLLTVAVCIDVTTNIPTFVTNGVGRPKVVGLASLAHAVIFLALIVPMGLRAGISGVAGAYLASCIAVTIPFIIYVNRHVVGITNLRLLRDAYFRPLLAAAPVLLLLLLLPRERINDLWLLLGVMGAGSVLYLALAAATGVWQERERALVRSYMGRLADAGTRLWDGLRSGANA
jgi:O-antigen/teichoic acid export membrane protein